MLHKYYLHIYLFVKKNKTILSSISRKWNKYASVSFDARSCEIEMRIAKKRHRLFDIKSLKLIILDTLFDFLYKQADIEI